MPRKQAEVEAALVVKGFKKTDSHHHLFIYWTADGRKSPVMTKTSHGEREIGDHLLAQMARQCKLSRGDFFGLVDCPLSRVEYEAKLKTGGYA